MSQRLTSINTALRSSISQKTRLHELREKSKINIKQLYQTVFPENIRRYTPQVYSVIHENPLIFAHSDIEDERRPEQRLRGAKQAMKIFNELQLNIQENPAKFEAVFYGMSNFGVGSNIKALVHYMLYMKSLLIFQANQFHRQCIRDGFEGKDFGCFALTEFHHGSFSRGIATEATYDKSSKEFVITTHGEKGMKFWIGAAWLTASMSIMWAQVIVDGKRYGPHPFVVRLRDRQTHNVLPGVTLLDCGPKNALDTIDNGGIKLDNIRVSVKNLLGTIGKIDDNGNYVSEMKSDLERFGRFMSPLSVGRGLIAMASVGVYTEALAITLRYVSQRRQFKDPKSSEKQILLIDYPLTRFRLLLPLAQTFSYSFGCMKISALYTENSKKFMDPKNKIVEQLHAISAVIKVKSTSFGSSLLSDCRQMLGGHGYSSYSRLGDLYQSNDVNLTWQGDNNVLLQQTSKFLLKFLSSSRKGQIINLDFVKQQSSDSLSFNKISATSQSLNCLDNLQKMLQQIFTIKYQSVVKQMSKMKLQKTDNSWNQLQPYFANQLALTFGDLYLFDEAYKNIKNIDASQTNSNRKFLELCLRVWSYSILLKQKIGTNELRKEIQNLLIEGCDLLYPDCISAIDAVAPPSYIIGSPFAKQDGSGMQAYINMFMTGKNTFERRPWSSKIIELRNEKK